MSLYVFRMSPRKLDRPTCSVPFPEYMYRRPCKVMGSSDPDVFRLSMKDGRISTAAAAPATVASFSFLPHQRYVASNPRHSARPSGRVSPSAPIEIPATTIAEGEESRRNQRAMDRSDRARNMTCSMPVNASQSRLPESPGSIPNASDSGSGSPSSRAILQSRRPHAISMREFRTSGKNTGL